ncbi:MAG: SH3 domain-containing protein, partial [Clostridiaceae bacterium]|nr:SH3 domain-containing protein [Clostridiaceae bacterium]
MRKRKRFTAGARGRLLVYGLPLAALVMILTLFVVKIASQEQVEVPLLDAQKLEAQDGLIDRDHPIPFDMDEDKDKDDDPAPSEPVILALPNPDPEPEPSESLTDPDQEDLDPGLTIITPDLVYAIADPVNIYAAPDLASDMIRSVSSGDSLIKLAQLEGWLQVQLRPGLEGYVRDNQVSHTRIFVPKTGESYYVQNRQVYVRSGPGTQHAMEGFALRGMSVKVLESGQEWSRIRTEHGLTGYMFNELFGPDKPADEITELERGRYMYVDTEEANLRESPSADSPKIGAAFMDDRVYQISDNGGWSK